MRKTADFQESFVDKVGKTDVEAILKSQKQHSGKKFFLAQVGQVAGMLK